MTTPFDGDATADGRADEAVLTRVRAACADLPEVEETELQDRPLFRVRRRRFVIVNGATSPARPRWDGFGRSLHLLADDAELEALQHDPRFRPSPHHGDRGWVALAVDPDTADWDEIAELIEAGYRRAAGAALSAQLDDRRGDP